MAEIESLKNISKPRHGGARVGAGHPKGKKTQKVLDREAASKVYKERVAKHADDLFHAQLDLAIGEKFLFVKTVTGTGKERKTTIEVVTDTEVIKQFLDDPIDLQTSTEYYFMTTKSANNQALEGMLNRSFGKAQERLDITTDGDKIGTPNPEVAAEFSEFLKGRTKE